MYQNQSNKTTLFFIVISILIFTGCAPNQGSIEEQIALVRQQYTVEINNFTVEKPKDAFENVSSDMGEGSASSSAVATAVAMEVAEEGEILTEEEIETGPQPRNVLLDLLIQFNGKKSLSGVTVDITQNNNDGQEKLLLNHFIDTTGMQNGDIRQINFELEDALFEEGDSYSVEIASGIPANLSNYREFSGEDQ